MSQARSAIALPSVAKTIKLDRALKHVFATDAVVPAEILEIAASSKDQKARQSIETAFR